MASGEFQKQLFKSLKNGGCKGEGEEFKFGGEDFFKKKSVKIVLLVLGGLALAATGFAIGYAIDKKDKPDDDKDKDKDKDDNDENDV